MVDLLLSLIYKLYHKYVCVGKATVCMGFGTICGFKHPLGVSECIPCEKRETTVSQLDIGSFQKVGGGHFSPATNLKVSSISLEMY